MVKEIFSFCLGSRKYGIFYILQNMIAKAYSLISKISGFDLPSFKGFCSRQLRRISLSGGQESAVTK